MNHSNIVLLWRPGHHAATRSREITRHSPAVATWRPAVWCYCTTTTCHSLMKTGYSNWLLHCHNWYYPSWSGSHKLTITELCVRYHTGNEVCRSVSTAACSALVSKDTGTITSYYSFPLLFLNYKKIFI